MILPAKNGKLDVGGAIGIGFLRVIRDMGLKDPYVGDVALQTGEVAEDLTYYFATSEQTPSSVGLGVLMNAQNHVQEAGGFIVQLMPEVTEEVIAQLERNIAALSSVTEMLSQNMSPEDILNIVLEGLSPVMLETHPARFFCDCSKERIERSLAALGTEDMNDLISENKPIEVRCQFCNKRYEFGMEELKKISSNKK